MARNEWVRDRLDNWARWIVQRVDAGQGYPRAAPFVRSAGQSASVEAMIPVDDVEASATHSAVESLRLVHSHLWLALMCHYVGDPETPWHRRRPLSQLETAARMRCTDRTVRAHLVAAETMVAMRIREREGSKGVLPFSGSW